jgi:protein-L-isoaspartate(D-aspartate) O-methyltransferase
MDKQHELLRLILSRYALPRPIIEAYLRCPRHRFVKASYSLDEIYADYPLEIFRRGEFVSTISQPSFVLLMIDLLRLEPHHRVLELGAGSGWNAALMSCLCAQVVTVEIIPELARETRANLRELGFSNVVVVEGDGAFGCEAYAPYDRGIFTAGASDLPRAFFAQIRDGGLLLFVLKTNYGDLLLLLEKVAGHFEERSRLRCSFVPVTGAKHANPHEKIDELLMTPGKIKIFPNSRGGGIDSVFSVT